MDKERNVYLDCDKIPRKVKVMAIKVKDPLILLMAEGGLDSEVALYRHCMVYVELTAEEFAGARGDQIKIDALAREFAPLVQRTLDAPWYRWVEEEDGSWTREE